MIPPTRAAATTIWPASAVGVGRDPDGDRVGDRRPGQRADEVRRRRHEDRVVGSQGPGRDRRRDRVGGVVEAVDVVEADRQQRGRRKRSGESRGHGQG